MTGAGGGSMMAWREAMAAMPFWMCSIIGMSVWSVLQPRTAAKKTVMTSPGLSSPSRTSLEPNQNEATNIELRTTAERPRLAPQTLVSLIRTRRPSSTIASKAASSFFCALKALTVAIDETARSALVEASARILRSDDR